MTVKYRRKKLKIFNTGLGGEILVFKDGFYKKHSIKKDSSMIRSFLKKYIGQIIFMSYVLLPVLVFPWIISIENVFVKSFLGVTFIFLMLFSGLLPWSEWCRKIKKK